MTLTPKIGFWWYQTFDSSGFLFNSLKQLHKSYRYLFYIALCTSLYFFIKFVGSYINLNDYRELSDGIKSILNICGQLLLFITVFFTTGIFSYESLFHLNLKHLTVKYKLKNQYIKENKLQYWRLRNMKWWIRILVYLGAWCFTYLIIEQASISAFLNVYEGKVNEDIYTQFLYAYNLFVKQFTIGFLIITFLLDFLVRKNIKARK